MSGFVPQALILDDSPVLSLLLQRQLEAEGFAVRAVGSEAALLQHATGAAVAFIELQLWQGNGFRMARRLAGMQACPVVLISGTGRRTDLHWGIRAGAAVVLTRPVPVQQLQQALQALGLRVAA